ncbi:MAG: hypothetical protein DPW12_09490 [Rhodocyclaceae bacterium]|nr:hypothetical protein [Bacteroidia bacterium]MCQ3924416.1 hypothetical protein [Rhodocyclaceae bacterium]HNQ56224.1 hypothetical protein [Candidatus Desulfobacillus denitrificans]HNT61521.1 hypothetical protein [Candidatus Desulfobacillus denitrificans]
MIVDRRAAERLHQLLKIVERELARLQATDRRLFQQPFTVERASRLNEDEDLAERVEAFVSRFGRLQDTLGDKVFPAYLAAQGEKTGAFGDNLDRAERLGLVPDAQSWIDMRRLRNQMVHEYIEDPVVLASALQAGHEFVLQLGQAVAVIRQLVPSQ